MTHTDGPHTHVISWVDNEGQSYSLDQPCPPGTVDEMRGLFTESGAKSINRLAVDGKERSFESAFMLLGRLGLTEMLGKEYQTTENLMKLLVAMGSPDEENEEATTPA